MFPPKEQISKKKKKSVSSSVVFLFSKSFAYFFIVAVLIFVSEFVYTVLLSFDQTSIQSIENVFYM